MSGELQALAQAFLTVTVGLSKAQSLGDIAGRTPAITTGSALLSAIQRELSEVEAEWRDSEEEQRRTA